MTRKNKLLGICLIAILVIAGSLSSYFCYGAGHTKGFTKGYIEGFEDYPVAIKFWENIEPLDPNTEYHFKSYITDDGGLPVNLPSQPFNQ